MASSDGVGRDVGDWSVRSAILFATQEEEESGEDEVDGDNHEDGGDDGSGRGAADLLRAAAGAEALVAAYRGDGGAEHEALDEAGGDVAKKQRIERSAKVTAESESGLGDAEERTAQHAHEIGPDGQAR